MAGPEDPNGGAGYLPVGKADTLDYLCEIIHDLKLMAEKAGYGTLAAILAAALVEARIQRKDAKR